MPGLAEEECAWRFRGFLSIILFCGWIYAIRIYLPPHYLLLHRNPALSQVQRQRLEFGAGRSKAAPSSKKSLGAEVESWMTDGTCRVCRLSHWLSISQKIPAGIINSSPQSRVQPTAACKQHCDICIAPLPLWLHTWHHAVPPKLEPWLSFPRHHQQPGL